MILTRLLGQSVSRKLNFSHFTILAMNLSTKVKVKQGTIVGGERSLPNGTPYFYYQGVPYAEPPLRDLRFQAPVPLEKFASAEIDCTKEGDNSYQKDAFTSYPVGSENCLFLNVYAPKPKSDVPRPVMVYIHGGGYLFGSGDSSFYTPLYLMQEDVVVVTFNYRLGPLGFLSLKEAGIPGNAGLKDQHVVLQWVKENISQFHGDPNNITLFGESAGAACVHFHTLSDKSKKLFHKAIMQSGTANMPWAVQENETEKAIKLAHLMGSTSTDPDEIVKFLKSYPTLVDFLKFSIAVLSRDEVARGLPIGFRPVIEEKSPEAIVTEEPLRALNKSNSIDIPIMMGYNSAEGIVMLANAIKKLNDFDKDIGRVIPRNMNVKPGDEKYLELANSVRDFYFKGGKVDFSTLNNFSDALGDFHFVIDAQLAAEVHSRKQHKSPLYFYRFDYVGKLNLFKKIFQLEKLKGACHADELFYVFQAAMAEEPWEPRDKKVVEAVCKLWANFAKHGNPTPDKGDKFVDCTWEPVQKIGDGDKFNLNAFIIDEKQTMLENPDKERVDFWRKAYQKYNGTPAKL